MPTKSIPIQLDKQRHLRFDFNALCALEDELGLSIAKLGNIVAGSVGLKDLRAIVWAGLIHEDESLTVKDVGNFLEIEFRLGKIAEIGDKIRQAFEIAFPAEKEGKKKEAGSNQGSGTGKNS